ncbi:type II toxin-antitoxin system RatA family toxin [Halocatena salina]|uniref:SRPBCC family protein n=1 Tax=Halocatena salina TaxID=2934340 RepID=A0A8U0A707_9EURY|nr:SRPBCC family protein [Halocatena salina]UPM43753.1 SRPBCC family protein [Halocatena salina]
MDAVEASTVVYLPPEEVYEFLVDFPRYANYSEHITEVRQYGEGKTGTKYDLVFAWWKLSYTARSEVTALDPPTRIDWELIKDVDAHGHWTVEHTPEKAPDDEPDASEVRLRVEFNPDSANKDAIDLPALVSLDWVIKKVTPKIEAEARNIVRRIVADLEGEERPVDVAIHTAPDSM